MSFAEPNADLLRLADLYGIEAEYFDIWGGRRTASSEQLVQVLKLLDAPINSETDALDALREHSKADWRRLAEPVVVAWDGRNCAIELRIPTRHEQAVCSLVLHLEGGEQRSWSVALADAPTQRSAEHEVGSYVSKRLELPEALPLGYHRLTIEVAGDHHETLIISAPTRAWTSAKGSGEKRWGVFMPLHALRSSESVWGGSLGDLDRLLTWTGAQGGALVGTLPLLATFLDKPFDPSPYAPASRLFWNELFLDLSRITPSDQSGSGQAPTIPQNEIESSRDAERVDYRPWAKHQRAALEELSQSFFANGGAEDPSYKAFLARAPRIWDYARFRAAAERQGTGWIVWPDAARDGHLTEADFDRERVHYHTYVQWQLERQLDALPQGDGKARLYLDFPLGVHPDSYDTWRERGSFAAGVAVGAPPDMFFTGGQNWGFPPLHPRGIRERSYGYLIEAIQNHTRHAGALRIDHVMGLSRLFWIPHGQGAQDGLYVRYPAEELYAILALESARAECLIVGEDLGTVPDAVREAMGEHDFLRMYVAQFEMSHNPDQALNRPPRVAMASVNTHDTVLFGGFWDGLDVEIMRALGLIDDHEVDGRQQDRAALMRALGEYLRRSGVIAGDDSPELAITGMLKHLAASDAQVLMVTLEDLWLERQPQNVPGTGDDWGNWRRKSQLSFEEFSSRPNVLELLREVDRLRRAGAGTS